MSGKSGMGLEAVASSGYYGDPPSIVPVWAIQTGVWVGSVVLARLVCAAFCFAFVSLLSWLGSGLDRLLASHARLHWAVALVLVPLALGLASAWVQDDHLKSQRPAQLFRRPPVRLSALPPPNPPIVQGHRPGTPLPSSDGKTLTIRSGLFLSRLKDLVARTGAAGAAPMGLLWPSRSPPSGLGGVLMARPEVPPGGAPP